MPELNNRRVLLIQPPIRDFYLTRKRTMPHGLACLASALQAGGFQVQLLDALASSRSRKRALPPEMDHLTWHFGRADCAPFGLFNRYQHFGLSYGRMGRLARESGAFLVGISSLFTPYAGEALLAAEAVKAQHPDCKVVLGGHHPTVMPEHVLGCAAVDFVLRGEGEVSLPLLARALADGGALRDIPGLARRRGDGSLQVAVPAWIEDLDSSPLPASQLVDRDFYSSRAGKQAVIVSSRGCPMRCSYCCTGANSGVPYRRRSLDHVLEEVRREVQERGARFIDFEDENLALNRRWFSGLLDRMGSATGGQEVELRAMNGLMPHTLDRQLLAGMRAAGFRTLNLSLGSCHAAQLRRFNRPDEVDDFFRVLGEAKDLGLQAVGYIIVGAPGQQAADSLADLLRLAAEQVLAGVSVYYPSPGSVDHQRCHDMGLLPGELSLYRSTALPISDPGGTSRLQAVTLWRLGRVVNFIKSLLDQGLTLPGPAPLSGALVEPLVHRQEAGVKLLAALRHDAKIRGVTPDGEVYEHPSDLALVRGFVEGLARVKLQGATSGAPRG